MEMVISLLLQLSEGCSAQPVQLQSKLFPLLIGHYIDIYSPHTVKKRKMRHNIVSRYELLHLNL